MNIIPIILTIHVLIVLALIGVVLLQRSEGGALGIGGGGGGGFMSGRGAASALTRMTSGLAFLFFATSLGLAMFAEQGETDSDIVDDITGTQQQTGETGEIGADDLGGIFTSDPDAPAEETDPEADPLRSIAIEEVVDADPSDIIDEAVDEAEAAIEAATEDPLAAEQEPQ